MDAEAYIEASRYVLQILWQVGISRHHQGVMWAKARVSAFEAIIHFEVNFLNEIHLIYCKNV